MEPAGGWDDAGQWDDRGGQAEPGWDDGSGWGASDDGRGNGHSGGQMSGWGYAEPSAAEWGESEPARARGGTARRQRMNPAEQRGQPRRMDDGRDGRGHSRAQEPSYAAGAYDDDPYGADYDQVDDEYDEEPSDRQRGRGWLGFLRRDKR
jgi:hypothetical protein